MKIKDPKIKKLWEPESEDGVTYLPCRFCGAQNYDYGVEAGDVSKTNIFDPKFCDVCNYGSIKGSQIPIH